MTANHEKGPFSQRAGPVDSAPIVIGDGSWIAAGVMILHGVTIGPGSIIGAGSVVTRDVPARTLALGTPARAVRRLSHDERPPSQPGRFRSRNDRHALAPTVGPRVGSPGVREAARRRRRGRGPGEGQGALPYRL